MSLPNANEATRDPTAWIRFHSYEKGWRDAAAGRVENESHTKHADEMIRVPYTDGFARGREDRCIMHRKAAQRFGYSPYILRSEMK